MNLGTKKNKSACPRRRTLCALAVFALGLALAFYAGRELWRGMRDYAAAQDEYAYLRGLSAVIAAIPRAAPVPAVSEDIQSPPGETPPAQTTEQVYFEPLPYEDSTSEYLPSPPPPPPDPAQIAASLSVFSEINPDFMGWIIISGTSVDYPVVRGPDNTQYLNTTFSGASNPSGAIFMDYRCTGGFDAPVSLIHGHNMRDGSMFSPLTGFLNRDFMLRHSEIIIVTADGEILVYRVFEARRTDAWDRVYTLDFNDAYAAAAFFGDEDSERFLILSTCLSGADRDARLLVLAVLVKE